MFPVYVSKNLIAASSTGVGSFSSAGVVTLNTSSLGTARRIIVWGSTSVAVTFTITGVSETGTPLTESIVGSTIGAAVATTQDFLRLTAVTLSAGVTSTQGYIGTNNQGGTPWKIVDTTRNPIMLGAALVFSSTANSMVASMEYTMDDPTATYPSPNAVPISFVTSGFSSVAINTVNVINADANLALPIYAWRMTLTSSSSGAGTVTASVLQSG